MIKLNGYEVDDFRFPDNTFRITMDENYWLSKCSNQELWMLNDGESLEITIHWIYEKPEELFMLQLLTMHCRDKMCTNNIHLVMPYIPNARMDRTHNPFGEVNTLKYFCKIINDLNFKTVTVCDPHSDASVNQLDHLIQYSTKDVVNKAFKMSGAYYIFFPDDGAAKRYSSVYNFAPFLNGKKNRDWATGKINGLTIENPIGIDSAEIGDRKILIIDDICSKGGTFWFSGLELKKFGFKHIDLYITHCEPAIFDGKLLNDDSPIEHIYTTDSVIRDRHDKITTLELNIY